MILPKLDYVTLKVIRFSIRNRNAIYLLTTILVIASIFGIFNLKIDPEFHTPDFLPQDLPVVQKFNFNQSYSEQPNIIIFKLENEDPKILNNLATDFAESLKSMHGLRYPLNLFSHITSDDYIDFRLHNITAFLTEDSRKKLNKKLRSNEIKRNLSKFQPSFSNYIRPTFWKSREDPLGIQDLIKSDILKNRHRFLGKFNDVGYLVNDKKRIYIFAELTSDVKNYTATEHFVKNIENIIHTLRSKYSNARIEYSGIAIIDLNNRHAVMSDLRLTAIIALLGTMLIFFFFVPQAKLCLIALICVLFTQVLTLGIGYLIFGRINVGSTLFSAVLVGIGIDGLVHIISAFIYSTNTKFSSLGGVIDKETQLIDAFKVSGRGVLIANLTSASGFLCLCLSEYGGLFQFGLLIAIGLLINICILYLFLPGMLITRSINLNLTIKNRFSSICTKLRERLLPYKFQVVTFSVIVVFISLFSISRLSFIEHIHMLYPKGAGNNEIMSMVSEDLGCNTRGIIVTVEGTDLQSVIYRSSEMNRKIQTMISDGIVAYHDSLLDYIPYRFLTETTHQETKLPSPEKFKIDVRHVLKRQFPSKESRLGAYLTKISDGLESEQKWKNTNVNDWISYLKSQLPEKDWDAYIFKEADRYVLRSTMYVAHSYPSSQLLWTLSDRIEGGSSHVRVSGVGYLWAEIKHILNNDLKWIPFVTACVCFMIVIFLIGSFKFTCLAFLPLAVGGMLTFLIIELLNIPLTYLSVAALPLLIALGIDDGVHIVNDYLSDKDISKSLERVSSGVLATTLTTTCGFVALLFAQFKAFNGLAFIMIIGMSVITFLTLIYVPLLLSTSQKSDD